MPVGDVRRVDAAPVTEYDLGDLIVRFDGTIVEVLAMGDTSRYHVRFLQPPRVEGPDRKGRHHLELRLRQGGGISTALGAECRPALDALVEDLDRAGVPRAG
ncbi:MAG TPA: hypothetical protein VKG43_14470 [Acidimicrobiales bacterium]|nr:hypothetical protein [Acidimicrobiales bacterium]